MCIMELLNSRMKEASQRWLHLQAVLQSFYSKHFISLRSFLSHVHFTETSVSKHLLHSETGLLVEWRSPLCLLLLCASWPQEVRSGASSTLSKLHPICSFHSLSKICISLGFKDAGLASESSRPSLQLQGDRASFSFQHKEKCPILKEL